MSVERQQAVVYRGGRRRWLSLKAACRAEARASINKRCECEKGKHDTPPETCFYHQDSDRYIKLLNRFSRMIESAWSAKNDER